jgi:hypothetical protein
MEGKTMALKTTDRITLATRLNDRLHTWLDCRAKRGKVLKMLKEAREDWLTDDEELFVDQMIHIIECYEEPT